MFNYKLKHNLTFQKKSATRLLGYQVFIRGWGDVYHG